MQKMELKTDYAGNMVNPAKKQLFCDGVVFFY